MDNTQKADAPKEADAPKPSLGQQQQSAGSDPDSASDASATRGNGAFEPLRGQPVTLEELERRWLDHDAKLTKLAAHLSQQKADFQNSEVALVSRIADVDDDRRQAATRLQRTLQSQRDELEALLRRQTSVTTMTLVAFGVLAALFLGYIYLTLDQSRAKQGAEIAALAQQVDAIAVQDHAVQQRLTREKLGELSTSVATISAAVDKLGTVTTPELPDVETLKTEVQTNVLAALRSEGILETLERDISRRLREELAKKDAAAPAASQAPAPAELSEEQRNALVTALRAELATELQTQITAARDTLNEAQAASQKEQRDALVTALRAELATELQTQIAAARDTLDETQTASETALTERLREQLLAEVTPQVLETLRAEMATAPADEAPENASAPSAEPSAEPSADQGEDQNAGSNGSNSGAEEADRDAADDAAEAGQADTPADQAAVEDAADPTAFGPADRPFSVQLMGFYSLDRLRDFAAKHELAADALYVRESYRGRPWYVLVHSLHKTREDAATAVAALPPNLAELKIWIRELDADSRLRRLQPEATH